MNNSAEVTQRFGAVHVPDVVKPLVTEPVEAALSDSLITRYVTKDDLATVRRALNTYIDAENEVPRVLAALERVTDQLRSAQRTQPADLRLAAAVALGETPPPEAPEPETEVVSVRALANQRGGLEERLKEARADVEYRKGQYRAAVRELILSCAVRCLADYEKATQAQAWCHQQIGLAQQLIGSERVVDLVTWNRYHVPGSPYVQREKCREEHGTPVLMSADRLSLTIANAARELRGHFEKLVGPLPL